jgi:hypothetical protein
MSGTSMFLEALAIRPILAQLIYCVTCTRYEAPPLVVQRLMNVSTTPLAARATR